MLLHHVIHQGKLCDIQILGNQIARIAPHIDASGDTVWDCTGKAILPSFANMHTHAAMTFLRGAGADKPLMDWLTQDIWPVESKLKAEHIYALSRMAILEMIKTGTTFFLDMYGDPQETVRAVQDMGIRAAIPYVALDFFKEDERDRRTREAQTYLSLPTPSERIIKGLSCHAIYTCSEEMIRSFFDRAQKDNLFFHIHLSETEKEVTDCLERYACRPVHLLHKWDVLNNRTILAHGVHFDETEIPILVDKGCLVAHCPTSNLKLGSGQMDLQKYLNAGIKVALGTDSVASNNSLSMISEMKLAALSAKSKAQDVTAGKVADIFHLATRAGFEAFGLNAGVIQEGALADFILVDLNESFLLPNTDLLSHMIYAADSSCITDVFCNGQPVMTNSHVENEEEIISEFRTTCHRLGIN